MDVSELLNRLGLADQQGSSISPNLTHLIHHLIQQTLLKVKRYCHCHHSLTSKGFTGKGLKIGILILVIVTIPSYRRKVLFQRQVKLRL